MLLIKPHMKRPFLVAALAVLVFSVSGFAATPDETYVQYYQAITQADSLMEKKQEAAALDHYYDAFEGLTALKKKSPKWNPDIVNFRLGYVKDKISGLESKYPEVMEKRTAAAAASKVPKKRVPKPVDPELERLTQEVINLRIQRSELEAQLREALAAKPSTMDPAELSRAQETIASLSTKVADLQAALETANSQMGDAISVEESRKMKKALEEANDSVADTQKEMASLKKKNASLMEELAEGKSKSGVLAGEVKSLQDQLKDLKKGKVVPEEKYEATEKQLTEARRSLERAEKENASLTKRVESLVNDPKVDALESENKALKKQLDDVSDAAKTIAKLQKANTELTASNKELSGEVDALSSSLKTAQSQMKKVVTQAELDKVESQLEASEKTAKSQSKELASLRKDLADSEKKTQSLEAMNASLDAKLESLDEALGAAEKKLSKVVTKDDLDAAKSALEKAEDAVDALEKDNRSLAREVSSLEKKLEAASTSRKVESLRSANDELKKRLDEALDAKAKLEKLLTDPNFKP